MKPNENILPRESFQDIRKIFNAIADISKKETIEGIAREACKQITLLVEASSCAISHWDTEENTVKLWAEYFKDTKKYGSELEEFYDLLEYPLTLQVLLSGEAKIVHANDPGANKAETQLLKQGGSKTLLMLPFYSGDKIIGLVEIISDDKFRDFSENEITLVRLLINQIGIEVNHTNLLDDANQRTAELSAIKGVSLGLTSNQSLDDVFISILEAALHLFEDAIDAHIFVYNQEKLNFGAALWADGRRRGPIAEPRIDGLTYTVAREAKIRVVENLATDPLYTHSPIKWEGAIIGLPLKNQNRVVGVMNIAFKKPRKFSDNVLNVLSMLGNQAAVAIERSHNVELITKRAAELEALRQANLALNASLNLKDVLFTVLKSALQFSDDAMDAHIFLKEGNNLVFGGALWPDGRIETKWNEPRKSGLTYKVFNSGKIIPVPNVDESDLYSEKNGWKVGKGFGAIVGLPIIAKDTVIGVLNLAYNTPQKFSEADLRSLALLSDQAALAVENARLHQAVSEQAVTDALTKLPNRRAFEAQFKNEVLRAKRYNHNFVLVMLDLNNFKWVNDNYGHPIGDKTLHMVGAFLKNNTRETDFIARLGGDEFALILPETTKKSALKRMKALTDIFMEHDFPWWRDNDENFVLKIITGLASYPEDGESVETLIKVADTEFYSNKKEAKS